MTLFPARFVKYTLLLRTSWVTDVTSSQVGPPSRQLGTGPSSARDLNLVRLLLPHRGPPYQDPGQSHATPSQEPGAAGHSQGLGRGRPLCGGRRGAGMTSPWALRLTGEGELRLTREPTQRTQGTLPGGRAFGRGSRATCLRGWHCPGQQGREVRREGCV